MPKLPTIIQTFGGRRRGSGISKEEEEEEKQKEEEREEEVEVRDKVEIFRADIEDLEAMAKKACSEY